jgi:N,N'-diacetyllegionaminate synthase
MSHQKVVVIAEAGVNHNGSIDLAMKLIDVAANAGVDYVKFQTFKSEKLVSKVAPKANYQKVNMNQQAGTQHEMLKKLELSEEDHYTLLDYCGKKGVKFMSTPFDLESADFLNTLQMDFFKISSGDITNLPLLKKIASFKKKVIFSTGMCAMNEISEALQVLLKCGLERNDITVLHCNTEYPTPFIDVNLKAMQTMANELGVAIGYSDHTLGVEVPIAAVALGAVIIEKHFTLDKSMEGPDHKASLEPAELSLMVKSIRNIELALGVADKKPTDSEKKNMAIARKSIHLSRDIEEGAFITENDLEMLRPGDGISPMNMEKVIGKVASKKLQGGCKLSWDDFK